MSGSKPRPSTLRACRRTSAGPGVGLDARTMLAPSRHPATDAGRVGCLQQKDGWSLLLAWECPSVADRVKAAWFAASTNATEYDFRSNAVKSPADARGHVPLPGGIFVAFRRRLLGWVRSWGTMHEPVPTPAEEPFPRTMAAFEHLMLADARPGHPMTFFLECEVEGPLCLDRLRRAVSAAARRHPLVRSRVGWRAGRPQWLPPDVEPQVESASRNAWRPIDLTDESGLRFVVLPQAGRNRIVMVAHHAAIDGVGACEFFGDLWACYDGREPPAFHAGRRRAPGPTAAVGVPTASPFRSTWPFLAFRPQPLARCASVPAVDDGSDASPFQTPFASHSLGRDLTAALRGVVTAHGWSLNDLVLAAVIRAAGRWNERCRGRAGNVRITLPVNLRATGSRSPARNDLGYAFLDRTPNECADVRRLTTGLAEASRWIVENDAAREFLGTIDTLSRRPWLLRGITRLPTCFSTAVVSTIGDPSRRMKSGVPKQDGLDAPGGLVIRAIRGTPPLRPGTRAAVATTTYAGELTLASLCSAVPDGRPSRSAAREFLSLIADELTAVA